MTRRNENVRNNCRHIRNATDSIENSIKELKHITYLTYEDREKIFFDVLFLINQIRSFTHSIKRTTWRGENICQDLVIETINPELIRIKHGKGTDLYIRGEHVTIPPAVNTKPIKHYLRKEIEPFKRLKPGCAEMQNTFTNHINTNQTTTSNIDVSTIPYY